MEVKQKCGRLVEIPDLDISFYCDGEKGHFGEHTPPPKKEYIAEVAPSLEEIYRKALVFIKDGDDSCVCDDHSAMNTGCCNNGYARHFCPRCIAGAALNR